jgi:hypothetical protein
VARNNAGRNRQDARAARAKLGGIRRKRILGRTFSRPPQVGERENVLGCADQRCQVLGSVAWGSVPA